MTNNNNMICDLETGVCGMPGDETMEIFDFNPTKKTVDLYYVTDPICSHCWALEPTLRRFKEEYGQYFNFHVVMGGLLEKWEDTPVDPKNGISGPSDVAGHWREVGEYSRMPIDGTLWYDNPLHSSYPPSRVFKVIQSKHNEEKAYEFLRRSKEQLFAFNQNIANESVLIEIINDMGLDGGEIVKQAESPFGQQLLQEDFVLARKLGARGFPTIIMINEENKGSRIVGARSLDQYVDGLKQVMNGQDVKAKERPNLTTLLNKEKLLFSKEIEVMYDIDKTEVKNFFQNEMSETPYDEEVLLNETYFTKK